MDDFQVFIQAVVHRNNNLPMVSLQNQPGTGRHAHKNTNELQQEHRRQCILKQLHLPTFEEY